MSKVRVYALSKELGLSNKDLIEKLKKLNVEVKSHSSSIEDEIADKIRQDHRKKSNNVKPEPSTEKPVVTEKKEKSPEQQKTAVEKKAEAVAPKPNPPAKKETPPKQEKKKEPVAAPPSVEEPVSEDETKQKKTVSIGEAVTVKELSDKMSVPPGDLIKNLILKGVMATMNQLINREIALGLAEEYGFDVEDDEEQSDEFEEEDNDKPEDLKPRYPIITIMGHVDHGKTTLLDAIRQTKVADGEAGGITQHIGAYEVNLDKGKVIFLDTPGHEAFTAMRARGADVTDAVILVVAADDGVMPQTIEAIHHANAAGVPIVVAVNKIDKPDANPDRVKQELVNIDINLTPEDWGGTTIYVNVSAKQRTGIDELLEMLLLQAEMLELKANPKGRAKGTIIEANLDKGRGPVATVLVKRGTLRVGDPFIVGQHFGKIRVLVNSAGKKVKEAGPSIPVEIVGSSGVPEAGDLFSIVESDKKARQISIIRSQRTREAGLKGVKNRISLQEFHFRLSEGEVRELNLIIKGDVQGSIQAISDSLAKIGNKDVGIRILHNSVGGVTESDVMLASASKAIIIAFNIEPSDSSVELAYKENVEIKKYSVIYDIISDVKLALEGLLAPTEVEKIAGKAEVREVFSVPKIGAVAGCFVNSGVIKKNSEVKLVRDSVIIYRGKISSLRRFKEDVREVQSGYECGIGLDKYNDIKNGDIIEPFFIEEIARKL